MRGGYGLRWVKLVVQPARNTCPDALPLHQVWAVPGPPERSGKNLDLRALPALQQN